MKMIRNLFLIAASALGLLACSSLDTMVACSATNSQVVGNTRWNTYDVAGCNAAKAEEARINEIERAAKGDSRKEYAIARAYETGSFVTDSDVYPLSVAFEKSRRRAITWYKKASQDKNSFSGKEAQKQLIRMGAQKPNDNAGHLVALGHDVWETYWRGHGYETGNPVEVKGKFKTLKVDREKAIQWYTKVLTAARVAGFDEETQGEQEQLDYIRGYVKQARDALTRLGVSTTGG